MWVICCCGTLPNIDAWEQEKRRGVFMAKQHVGHLFHIKMSSYMKTLVIRFVVVMPFCFCCKCPICQWGSALSFVIQRRCVLHHSLWFAYRYTVCTPHPPAINYQKQTTGCERVGLHWIELAVKYRLLLANNSTIRSLGVMIAQQAIKVILVLI